MSEDKKIVLKKIEEIYNKYSKKDWNGYSASPINKKQKEIIKEFVEICGSFGLYKKIQTPYVIPDPCGEIWLVWTTIDKSKKLTIAISKEKILTYNFRDRKNKANNFICQYRVKEKHFISDDLLKKLKHFLK